MRNKYYYTESDFEWLSENIMKNTLKKGNYKVKRGIVKIFPKETRDRLKKEKHRLLGNTNYSGYNED